MGMTTAGGITLMARNAGLTNAAYEARRAAGEKFCMTCAAWHPLAAFGIDRSRYDGRRPKCRTRYNAEQRTRYATARAR
jgi:hypothetical protein